MKEYLLDKAAWDADRIQLADAPSPISDYSATGYSQAYGGMVSYESALDAAGYAREDQMHEPDAKIWVTMCKVTEDGGLRAAKSGRSLAANVDEVYLAHGMLAPAREREAAIMADLANSASTRKQATFLLQQAAFELGREIIVDFESASGELDLSFSFSGPGAVEWPKGLDFLKTVVAKLMPHWLRAEIPTFDEGKGAEGRIRIAKGQCWLDAVDHNEDWQLERELDTDLLDEEDDLTL